MRPQHLWGQTRSNHSARSPGQSPHPQELLLESRAAKCGIIILLSTAKIETHNIGFPILRRGSSSIGGQGTCVNVCWLDRERGHTVQLVDLAGSILFVDNLSK